MNCSFLDSNQFLKRNFTIIQSNKIENSKPEHPKVNVVPIRNRLPLLF
jgi:hypothetical protein